MSELKTDYLSGPLGVYLDRLAAREPVPGGGSVAALALALAAALLSMTANFTLGKKKFAAVETDVAAALEAAESLRRLAGAMAEEDSRVYLRYREASARPRDDPGRGAALREAAAAGNDFLFSLAGRAEECLDIAAALLEKGNPLLASDVACAAALARAAFECAEANILINLRSAAGPSAGSDPKADLARRRKKVLEASAKVMAGFSAGLER